MRQIKFILFILLMSGIAFGQTAKNSKAFQNFPKGADPAEVGTKVSERFLQRPPFEYRFLVHRRANQKRQSVQLSGWLHCLSRCLRLVRGAFILQIVEKYRFDQSPD